jgi:outer membrane protein assembly factor BamB
MRQLFLLVIIVSGWGCSKKSDKPASGKNDIVSFQLEIGKNPGLASTIFGKISKDTIYLNIAAGVQLNNLLPTIKHTGIKISPDPSIPQNFSSAVTYTVTAENGNKKTFKTAVTILAETNSITSFKLRASINTGLAEDITANIEGDSIFVLIPPGIDIKNLRPTIEHNGVRLEAASEQSRDFSLPVNYEVRAGTGAPRNYTVFTGSNKAVYLAGADGYLRKFNGLSGKIIWEQYVGGNNIPTYNKGVLFLVGPENKILALNAADGSIKWQHTLMSGIYGLTLPTVRYGNVYFTGAGSGVISRISGLSIATSFVFALDEETGAEKWFNYCNRGEYMFGEARVENVAVGENVVISHEMYAGAFAYDALTGTKLWDEPIGYAAGVNPTIHNGIFYFGNENGIRIGNLRTGETIYEFVQPEWEKVVFSGSVIYKDLAYLFNFYDLIGMDGSGNIQWKIPYGSLGTYDKLNTPTIIGDKILATNQRDNVVNVGILCYDITEKKLNWIASRYHKYVVGSGKDVYACNAENQLACLDLGSGIVKWTTPSGTGSGKPFITVDYADEVHTVSESGQRN